LYSLLALLKSQKTIYIQRPELLAKLGGAALTRACDACAMTGEPALTYALPSRSWNKGTMEWLDAFTSHALALAEPGKVRDCPGAHRWRTGAGTLVRIPELVGLLVVGVLLGPHVLDLYGVNHPIVQFFADLGRLMLIGRA